METQNGRNGSAPLIQRIREFCRSHARLRRIFRDNQDLIAWQKERHEALLRRSTAQRAETFALLSQARPYCPEPLARQIDEMIRGALPATAAPLQAPVIMIPKFNTKDASHA